MDSPLRELPTPTIAPPPPVALVADWLLTPVDEPEEEFTVDPPGEVPVPLELVVPPRLNAFELEPPRLLPALPLTVEVPPGLETIDDAEPRPPAPPGRPARGWPKKPLTVVFASP
jgi:hypothetical protein